LQEKYSRAASPPLVKNIKGVCILVPGPGHSQHRVCDHNG
jgi:hypothetical protein